MSADMDAGSDTRRASGHDRAQAHLEAIIEDLWHDLVRLRQRRGSPSYKVMARNASPRSTIAEWFTKRSVVPDWPEFAELIAALGEQPTQWTARWQDARSAYADLRQRRTRTPAQDDQGASPQPTPGTPTRTGAVAPAAAIWKRLGRSQSQRVAVALTAVVAIAVGGGAVLMSQDWTSADEPTRMSLKRYQAPTPDRANFISPTEPGPEGWAAMPAIGDVYAPKESRIAGLIPIYRYRCTNCEGLVYFLSRDKSKRRGFALEGEAFRCFNTDNPPADTRPLQSLINRHHARIWAVRGTSEYDEAVANGFRDPSPDAPALCSIY